MIRWKIGFLSAACWIALVAAAKAQAPGMTAWWDRPVARNLGLSDEQDRKIRITVRDSRTRLIELRGAVEAAEADLRDEMNEETVDSSKAEAAINRVVAARGELMRAVSRMSLQLRLILTAAQWQELEKREGVALPGRGRAGRMPGQGNGRGVFRPPNSPE
jgi:Spy/CpxP family protein refolding chaperone